MGGCQIAKSRPIWKIMATELQSYRVTELQTPKGTQYMGGWNFLCMISINSPTRLACRGITLADEYSLYILKTIIDGWVWGIGWLFEFDLLGTQNYFYWRLVCCVFRPANKNDEKSTFFIMRTRGTRDAYKEKRRKKFIGQWLGVPPKSWLTPKRWLLICNFVVFVLFSTWTAHLNEVNVSEKLSCASCTHDEKDTFFIIFECFLLFSTMVEIHNISNYITKLTKCCQCSLHCKKLNKAWGTLLVVHLFSPSEVVVKFLQNWAFLPHNWLKFWQL